MKRMTTSELALVGYAQGSRNCGNAVETAVVMSTCSVAGGLIGFGLSGGNPLGAKAGQLIGSLACTYICYYHS